MSPSATMNSHADSKAVNGKTKESEPPATRMLAEFAAAANTAQLTPMIQAKVKEVLIDYVGVVVGALDNADSTAPIYDAIVKLQGEGTTGRCTVIGKGAPHMLPQYAGLLNSAFGHSLDFDDTHAAGTVHAGVIAVAAAMTQAEVLGTKASSADFMLAVSVGYEVTCRLARELGYEAYSRGFHNTGTAGIFGAVAAISVLKRLPADTIEMAFGLAGSKAAGSMQYLDNGSWNKRLHPGFAVHDAFMSVALAESGVIGATRILEGKSGFLNAYSPNPHKDLHRLTAGLGTEWMWLASSIKPYPACRMTHACIELCGNAHTRRKSAVAVSDIKRITLAMTSSNHILVGDPTPNKIHPTNVIDAQFSAYFQVAHALLYGAPTGLQAYGRLDDRDIGALSEKIEVIIDEGMERFGAGMQIEWADGQVEKLEQQHPLGEEEHPFSREGVERKFNGLVEPVFEASRAKKIVGLVDELEERTVEELLALLR